MLDRGLICKFRASCTALIVVIAAGCGDGLHEDVEIRDGVEYRNPVTAACEEVKMLVNALEYVLRSSKFERTAAAYAEFGGVLHDQSQKRDFGEHTETLGKLAILSGEVKPLLEQKPPDTKTAIEKIAEMRTLVNRLPGRPGSIEDVWEDTEQ